MKAEIQEILMAVSDMGSNDQLNIIFGCLSENLEVSQRNRLMEMSCIKVNFMYRLRQAANDDQ